MFANIGDLTSNIISSEKNLPLICKIEATLAKPGVQFPNIEGGYKNVVIF